MMSGVLYLCVLLGVLCLVCCDDCEFVNDTGNDIYNLAVPDTLKGKSFSCVDPIDDTLRYDVGICKGLSPPWNDSYAMWGAVQYTWYRGKILQPVFLGSYNKAYITNTDEVVKLVYYTGEVPCKKTGEQSSTIIFKCDPQEMEGRLVFEQLEFNNETFCLSNMFTLHHYSACAPTPELHSPGYDRKLRTYIALCIAIPLALFLVILAVVIYVGERYCKRKTRRGENLIRGTSEIAGNEHLPQDYQEGEASVVDKGPFTPLDISPPPYTDNTITEALSPPPYVAIWSTSNVE